jgi:5-methylcytosine-specific restriction enzyme subunit McrC
VSSQSFRLIHLDRNSSFYRFLLNICELVQTARLPEEKGGHYRFQDFLRDERKMAYLFQYFVYNFLRLERRDLIVRRENIPWKVDSPCGSFGTLLPQMQTDISVISPRGKTIIDTKYYRQTLSNYYGVERIRSDHLYQMTSYLVNASEPNQPVGGILLYPLVDRELKERYSILGMTIRVETLNLDQPWNFLHSDLVGLLEN